MIFYSGSKSRSQNKKNKNKNMTCVKQKSNKILSQKWNKNIITLWQKNVPKIGVEQIKSKFYKHILLFILLGDLIQGSLHRRFVLMCGPWLD
jgi:hypothetical protein